MPTPTINRLLQPNSIEVPKNTLFYINPDLDKGCSTLTDWAGVYGESNPRTIVNLLPRGNFESVDDLNWAAPNIAGSISISSLNKQFGTSAVRVTTNLNGCSLTEHIATPDGNKIYCCAWNYRISGVATEVLRAFDYFPLSHTYKNAISVVDKNVFNLYPTEQWMFSSLIRNAVDGGISLVLNTASLSKVDYLSDGIMVIDLTATFGAGNEPTQKQMDEFVQNRGFFVETKAVLDRNPIITNMLGSYGNFGQDTNMDGLADKLSYGGSSYINYNFSTNKQIITASPVQGEHYVQFSDSDIPMSWNVGDKIYLCGLIKAITGGGKLYLFNKKADGTWDAAYSDTVTANTFTFASVEITVTSKNDSPRLYARAALMDATNQNIFSGNGESIELKQFILINKTAVYGAGLEPTRAYIDDMVQKRGFFVETREYSGRPEIVINGAQWAIDKNVTAILRFDGVDDYLSYPNTSNTDIRSATPDKPLSVFGVFSIDTDFLGSGYILCVNDSVTTDIAYGWAYNHDGQLVVFLNGVTRLLSAMGTLSKGRTYFAGFSWDGSNIKAWVNGKLIATAPYSGVLPYRPNFSIGRRKGGAYGKGLYGEQLIAQTTTEEIEYWARKTKLYEKYNIAA